VNPDEGYSESFTPEPLLFYKRPMKELGSQHVAVLKNRNHSNCKLCSKWFAATPEPIIEGSFRKPFFS
jgi:hypothetical protein